MMMRLFMFCTLVCISACGQKANKDECKIGEYFKVEDYDFTIQLPHSPRISLNESKGLKIVRYDYAMEDNTYDNLLYGLMAIKQDTLDKTIEVNDSVTLLAIYDKTILNIYDSVHKATLISRQSIKFKNRNAFKYKFKAFNPAAKIDMIINHLLLVDKKVVIQMYVYTLPEKQDNKLIDCYFDKILFY